MPTAWDQTLSVLTLVLSVEEVADIETRLGKVTVMEASINVRMTRSVLEAAVQVLSRRSRERQICLQVMALTTTEARTSPIQIEVFVLDTDDASEVLMASMSLEPLPAI